MHDPSCPRAVLKPCEGGRGCSCVGGGTLWHCSRRRRVAGCLYRLPTLFTPATRAPMGVYPTSPIATSCVAKEPLLTELTMAVPCARADPALRAMTVSWMVSTLLPGFSSQGVVLTSPAGWEGREQRRNVSVAGREQKEGRAGEGGVLACRFNGWGGVFRVASRAGGVFQHGWDTPPATMQKCTGASQGMRGHSNARGGQQRMAALWKGSLPRAFAPSPTSTH